MIFDLIKRYYSPATRGHNTDSSFSFEFSKIIEISAPLSDSLDQLQLKEKLTHLCKLTEMSRRYNELYQKCESKNRSDVSQKVRNSKQRFETKMNLSNCLSLTLESLEQKLMRLDELLSAHRLQLEYDRALGYYEEFLPLMLIIDSWEMPPENIPYDCLESIREYLMKNFRYYFDTIDQGNEKAQKPDRDQNIQEVLAQLRQEGFGKFSDPSEIAIVYKQMRQQIKTFDSVHPKVICFTKMLDDFEKVMHCMVVDFLVASKLVSLPRYRQTGNSLKLIKQKWKGVVTAYHELCNHAVSVELEAKWIPGGSFRPKKYAPVPLKQRLFAPPSLPSLSGSNWCESRLLILNDRGERCEDNSGVLGMTKN